ncbi:hypothetical protein DENSPDRAFT_861195 [Dentipellis sp. KUC8613]|nr:hypothetical protein DENSPDRAFT_861195 [Dentipellis sp. KUC8613]
MSDSPEIALERSFWIGVIVSSMLYGLQVQVYLQTVYLMLRSPSLTGKSLHIYLISGSIINIGMTIAVAANDAFAQLMWIEHRDFPGGPLGYLSAKSSLWVNTFSTAGGILAQIVADGILIYRCYIIWSARWSVIILPSMIYLTSIAMGIVELVMSAAPESDFFRGNVVHFTISWASLSVAVNAVVTLLICTRLLHARRFMDEIMPDGSADLYTSVVAILVESALPVTIIGIVYVVVDGKNLDVAPAFSFIWGAIGSLSPQLILLRVAMGRAWTAEVASHVNSRSLQFAPASTSVTQTVEDRDLRWNTSTQVGGGGSSTKIEPSMYSAAL